jgi:hypothetical protein
VPQGDELLHVVDRLRTTLLITYGLGIWFHLFTRIFRARGGSFHHCRQREAGKRYANNRIICTRLR